MRQIIFEVSVDNKKQWLVKHVERNGYFYKSANAKTWERLTEDRFLSAVEEAKALRILHDKDVIAEYKLVPTFIQMTTENMAR